MECFKCNKSFKSKQNLQFHLDKKIKCDRVLECDNCKMVFQTKYKLERHLNNKIKCIKITPEIELISAKKEIIELKKELLNTKKENIEYKLENNKLKQTLSNNVTNNINNVNGDVNINNGTINNNINIFGSESIEHITQKILEQEILKIVQNQYDECYKQIMIFQNIRYESMFIKMVDIHLLMTKLIYFTKKKNKTMKKENNKYFINNEDGWEETNLEQMNIKILTKHQEVLVQCKSAFIDEPTFRKVLEFYFNTDDDKLIVEVGKIELFISEKRLILLNQVLDYELENMDKLDKMTINHDDNIVIKK